MKLPAAPATSVWSPWSSRHRGSALIIVLLAVCALAAAAAAETSRVSAEFSAADRASDPRPIPTAGDIAPPLKPDLQPVPPPLRAPAPRPAVRPPPLALSPAAAEAERLRLTQGVRSWGYQLQKAAIEELGASPYDLLVVDATLGQREGRPFEAPDVAQLKRKADGSRRLVVSYLSVGEAEDYRPDYFSPEYLEEDAPDWLLEENPVWKGNRIIRFCKEGWQQTILGDANGRSVYSLTQASPLYRLIEKGFDGVYLDRVDVYQEVEKHCPNAKNSMVEFVERLAAHARRANPRFLVILQNAEALLAVPAMIRAIDAVGKEDLFYGADYGQRLNARSTIDWSLGHLQRAKAAGRAIYVVDYVTDRAARADARRRIEAEGFVPYIGPRDLSALWLRDRDF